MRAGQEVSGIQEVRAGWEEEGVGVHAGQEVSGIQEVHAGWEEGKRVHMEEEERLRRGGGQFTGCCTFALQSGIACTLSRKGGGAQLRLCAHLGGVRERHSCQESSPFL